MAKKNTRSQEKQAPVPGFRRFIWPFGVYLALVFWGCAFLYYQERQAAFESLKSSEKNESILISKDVTAELSNIFTDIQLVQSNMDFRQFINTPDYLTRLKLEKEFISFSAISTAYDQIRIIDVHGEEMIRVNYNNGRPYAVENNRTQDKSSRYYFNQIMALPEGRIYVSPMDLNIEHGELEIPLKPVFRIGMPIFDTQGQKQGAIILNYRAVKIFQYIWRLAKGLPGRILLLNPRGYYLIGPQPEDEWGFMEHRPGQRSFFKDHPNVWEIIGRQEAGQLTHANGLFTFNTIHVAPGRLENGLPNASHHYTQRKWKLVFYIPPQDLRAISLKLVRHYLAMAVMLAAMGLLGTWMYAKGLAEKQKATAQLVRAKETAEAASRAKSQFLASMGHEFRTPLNAIIGFSQVLADGHFGPLNEKQGEFLADIFNSATHLNTLINDALDLSEVEFGRTRMDFQSVPAGPILRESVALTEKKAAVKEIAISRQFPEDMNQILLWADEGRIRQVIQRIMDNAVKFSEPGGRITVSAHVDETKNMLVVEVTDLGMGIADHELDHLFDLYYQAHSSSTDKTPGTGLGLSMAQKLVHLHGGEIWAKSKGEGKGALFGFCIPLAK